MLQVNKLSKTFGGVKAVQDVSFAIREKTIHSVIGPNGAGKTTLFNLITGVYTPSEGEIVLDGENVAGASPDQLARRGMSRTFQNLQVCMNMSAVENVMVGAHWWMKERVWDGALKTRRARSGRRARLLALGAAERYCQP